MSEIQWKRGTEGHERPRSLLNGCSGPGVERRSSSNRCQNGENGSTCRVVGSTKGKVRSNFCSVPSEMSRRGRALEFHDAAADPRIVRHITGKQFNIDVGTGRRPIPGEILAVDAAAKTFFTNLEHSTIVWLLPASFEGKKPATKRGVLMSCPCDRWKAFSVAGWHSHIVSRKHAGASHLLSFLFSCLSLQLILTVVS